MAHSRFILKAYDGEGHEAFPEKEFLGESLEQAAAACAAFVAGRAGSAKPAEERPLREGSGRRKAATGATGPKEKKKKTGGGSR